MAKHPGGRPTLYDQSFCEKAAEYLKQREDQRLEIAGRPSIRVQLPTIEGFARFLGVHKDSLYEWESLYPEFSDTLDKIRTEQQIRLIDNGLSGDYNPTIAKLILSSNHGMAEKTESKEEHSGTVGLTIVTKIPDANS